MRVVASGLLGIGAFSAVVVGVPSVNRVDQDVMNRGLSPAGTSLGAVAALVEPRDNPPDREPLFHQPLEDEPHHRCFFLIYDIASLLPVRFAEVPVAVRGSAAHNEALTGLL